jgi:hypothetical protein
MQILSEKEIEDVLVLHSELIEEGLALIDRQTQLENRRTDLMFKDKNNSVLLIELKKDIIAIDHLLQIEDYILRMKKTFKKSFRAMLIGQEVPLEIRSLCASKQIEWKEIKVDYIFEYLKKHDANLYHDIFIEGKLHKRSQDVDKITFHEYLNATSLYGVPYSSYQFFKPVDASPELSPDIQMNMQVADKFFDKLKNASYEVKLFNGAGSLRRKSEEQPYWTSFAKGSWQGYVMEYELKLHGISHRIPCRLYLGTIGYRGNKPIFADEKSRFAVFYIGTGKNEMITQYGFHKYLRTEKQSLLPFYELKFNSAGIPPHTREDLYASLSKYGYHIANADKKKSIKVLWLGDIDLRSTNIDAQIRNFIESMFSLTIIKSHYNVSKGYKLKFLES